MASILNVDQISSVGGTISIESNVNLSLENTDSYVILPTGNTIERDTSPTEGSLRWNNDFDIFEVYDGIKWRIGRRVYDFDLLEGFATLSLDSGDFLQSYPGYGEKWFNNSFSPYKTLFNTTPFFNNSNGGFFEFDGSNYSTTIVDDFLRPVDQISQECWFKTNSNTLQIIVSLQYGISTNNSFALYIDGANWRAGINQAGTFTEITQPFSSTPLLTNQWYHFVHTFSRTPFVVEAKANTQAGSNILEIVSGEFNFISGMEITGSSIPVDTTDPENPIYTTITSIDELNNRITISNPTEESLQEIDITCTLPSAQFLYVNGELINYQIVNSPVEIDYTVDNNLITIGADFQGPGVSSGPSNYLNGGLSIVRIHSNALKPKEVESNFNIIKGRYGY